MMTFEQYRLQSERTLNPDCKPDTDNYLLGMIGELGEVTELVKKFLYHGHQMQRDLLCKELGDLCFYVAAEATRNNLFLRYGSIGDLELIEPVTPGSLCRAAARCIANYDTLIEGSRPLLVEAASELCYILRIVECIAAWFSRFNLTMDEILQTNIDKLLIRYPDGFSPAASLQRTA